MHRHFCRANTATYRHAVFWLPLRRPYTRHSKSPLRQIRFWWRPQNTASLSGYDSEALRLVAVSLLNGCVNRSAPPFGGLRKVNKVHLDLCQTPAFGSASSVIPTPFAYSSVRLTTHTTSLSQVCQTRRMPQSRHRASRNAQPKSTTSKPRIKQHRLPKTEARTAVYSNGKRRKRYRSGSVSKKRSSKNGTGRCK